MNRYPVYVISKGRWENPLTANMLRRDGVPFKLVVEPPEADHYRDAGFADEVTELPFHDLGLGGIPARNWCWEDSIAEGHARHWILDDNIRNVRRTYKRQRIVCEAGAAFAAVEDFTERYTNVGLSGLCYTMFVPIESKYVQPIVLNGHVYSCILIDNSLPFRWRGRYNEDTDLCLQVLSHDLCTILVNAFTVDKMRTMNMKGGNTDELYRDDGRLRMARALERQWPGVVKVDRRWGRPQHVIDWKRFRTQLQLRPDAPERAEPNEYGMRLKAQGDVRSPRLQEIVEHNAEITGG